VSIYDKIKCAVGWHPDTENIGAGIGSALLQGHQVVTECRIWRCRKCGHECGRVTCPQVQGFGHKDVDPEFVRKTSRYQDFRKAKTAEGRVG